MHNSLFFIVYSREAFGVGMEEEGMGERAQSNLQPGLAFLQRTTVECTAGPT